MVVLSVQFLCELCVQGYSSMQRHLIASRVRVHRECARTLFAAVDCATFNGYVVCIYKGCAFLCAWQDEVIQGQRASSKSKGSRVSALDFRFHSCIHSKAKPSNRRDARAVAPDRRARPFSGSDGASGIAASSLPCPDRTGRLDFFEHRRRRQDLWPPR